MWKFSLQRIPACCIFLWLLAIPMLLQLSSSTVVLALDRITQQDTLVIGSLSKKKKQKKNSKSCPEEDINSEEFRSGEKALSFIASLLDMLLLKKDLTHRSLEIQYAYICMSIVNFGHLRLFLLPNWSLIIILLLRVSLIMPLFKLLQRSIL